MYFTTPLFMDGYNQLFFSSLSHPEVKCLILPHPLKKSHQYKVLLKLSPNFI